MKSPKHLGFISNAILLKGAVFTIFFAGVFLLKHPTLNLAPVWDSLSGVFAPAVYLYETNFDFANLVQQPGWWEGGPNTHSFSITTFITVFVLWLTDGEHYFRFLHIFNYALTALVLTTQYFLVGRLYGKLLGMLTSFVTFFFPPFFVQSGYMYTEMAGSAMLLLSLTAWHHRKATTAIILSMLSELIKALGLVGTVAISTLLILDSKSEAGRNRKLLWKALILIVASILVEIIRAMFTADIPDDRPFWNPLSQMYERLLETPDLIGLIGIGTVSTCYLLISRGLFSPLIIFSNLIKDLIDLKRLQYFYILSTFIFLALILYDRFRFNERHSFLLTIGVMLLTYIVANRHLINLQIFIHNLSDDIRQNEEKRLFVGTTLFLISFYSFLIVVSMYMDTFLALTRYYTWIIPIAVINAFILLRIILRHIIPCPHDDQNYLFRLHKMVLLATSFVLIGLMALNYDGRFYPNQYNRRLGFSKLERSMEYVYLYWLQKKDIASLIKLPNIPIYLPHNYHYLLQSPLMGYVDQPMSNARFILDHRHEETSLENFPSHFAILLVWGSYGANMLLDVLTLAIDKGCQYHRQTLSSGKKYGTHVYTIDCRSE